MSHLRKLRSDSARHREALLEAATHALFAKGPKVRFEEIAEIAGVGRATLYRHFPDRASLLLALFDRGLGAHLEAAKAAAPGKALIAIITSFARAACTMPTFFEAWQAAAPHHQEMLARQNQLFEILQGPLDEAIAAGEVRSDLKINDVMLAITMVRAASLTATDTLDATARIIDLMFYGIGKSS